MLLVRKSWVDDDPLVSSSQGRPLVALRVVYRSANATNGKPRPEYYSKHTALLSLLRAAEAVTEATVQLVFVNDGPLPADLMELQRLFGRIVPIREGSNRGSYRAALRMEAARAGGVDDLVWFAEDDYLYSPGSLKAVVDAAMARPDADYFAMYGSDALDVEASTTRRAVLRPRPGAELDPHATRLPDASWYRAHSTTSTFGVRRRALGEDLKLLRRMPFTGGAWDRATCLGYQGYRPFGARDLLGLGAESTAGLLPAGTRHLTPRGLGRGAVRAVADLALRRRPVGRRVLLGSDPELIRHMEIIEGTRTREPSAATQALDWNAIAADTLAWAERRDLTFPARGSITLPRHA